jgi:hypothetical protein
MAEEYSRDSFVASIWLEPGSNGVTTWRGHIRHVQGKEDVYFQNLMEMREFLGRVSEVAGPPLTAQPLQKATKSGPSAIPEPPADIKSDTVTNMKQKGSSEIQMQPMEQPTTIRATRDQDDPQNFQPEVLWGGKLFLGVLITVLVFFWWLLIDSGGVAGIHG